MGKKQFDWEAIEHEYITSEISYRDLSQKHKVSLTTLYKYAREGKWSDKKKVYCKKVCEKAVQKSCNKEANKLAKILSAVNNMQDIVSAKLAQDADQFNRWIVQERNIDGSTTTQEVICDKIDTKALSEMVKTLQGLEKLQRSLNNIMTEKEKQQMEIERGRYELEKKKADDLSEANKEVTITFKNMDEGWDE